MKKTIKILILILVTWMLICTAGYFALWHRVKDSETKAFVYDTQSYLSENQTFVKEYGKLISLVAKQEKPQKSDRKDGEYYMDFVAMTEKGRISFRSYHTYEERWLISCESIEFCEKNGKLIVEGREVFPNTYVRIPVMEKNPSDVELPLLAICEAIGATIKKGEDDRIYIKKEKEYVLNIQTMELLEKGVFASNYNWLSSSSETDLYIAFLGEECVVSAKAVEGFIFHLGFTIVIDYDNYIVQINKIE